MKRVKTYNDQYGYDNIAQHPSTTIKKMKSGYNYYDKNISGIEFTGLQGYEDIGIEYLINEKDISPNNVLAGASNAKKYTYHKL